LSVTEEDISRLKRLSDTYRYAAADSAGSSIASMQEQSNSDILTHLALQRILAAITTPSVPSVDGWKVVPVEPTREMIQAGEGAHYAAKNRVTDARTADAYRAMLAASPEPSNLQNMQSAPSSPEGGGGDSDWTLIGLADELERAAREDMALGGAASDLADTANHVADCLKKLSPATTEGVSEAVAGPVWAEEGAGEDGETIWTSEVQSLGGYGVIATVHGATEAEAIARRDLVLAALHAPRGEG
jgi:hypothetical protein